MYLGDTSQTSTVVCGQACYTHRQECRQKDYFTCPAAVHSPDMYGKSLGLIIHHLQLGMHHLQLATETHVTHLLPSNAPHARCPSLQAHLAGIHAHIQPRPPHAPLHRPSLLRLLQLLCPLSLSRPAPVHWLPRITASRLMVEECCECLGVRWQLGGHAWVVHGDGLGEALGCLVGKAGAGGAIIHGYLRRVEGVGGRGVGTCVCAIGFFIPWAVCVLV